MFFSPTDQKLRSIFIKSRWKKLNYSFNLVKTNIFLLFVYIVGWGCEIGLLPPQSRIAMFLRRVGFLLRKLLPLKVLVSPVKSLAPGCRHPDVSVPVQRDRLRHRRSDFNKQPVRNWKICVFVSIFKFLAHKLFYKHMPLFHDSRFDKRFWV